MKIRQMIARDLFYEFAILMTILLQIFFRRDTAGGDAKAPGER